MANDSFYKPQKEEIFTELESGIFDRSRKKSSRSKADFFELLLVKELNRYYKLSYEHLTREIKKLINKIKKFKDSHIRVEEQKYRVKLLLPSLIQEINKLLPDFGNPIKISWIGRKWQTNRSLSDINIKFSSGKSIGISTKSTRSGKGTQKNIGLKELKRYLGLQIDRELQEMKNKIISKVAIQNKELRKIAGRGMTSIRKNKYRFQVIQKIGKEFGIPIQKLAVKESVRLFNGLNVDRKKEFVKFILGFNEEELLLNAFISGKQNYIYWNKEIISLIGDDLTATEEGSKGYYILSKGKHFIRIQVNFTNGIGISAFCERAFL